MLRTYHCWTKEEEQILKDNYNLFTRQELADKLCVSLNAVKRKAYDLRLVKPKEVISKLSARPNSGQFKTGHTPGNTKHDFCLTLRIDAKGRLYYWIRVSLAKWVMYHVYLWLKAGKTIPEGYILRFRDGDTLKVNLANLQLVSKAEHMEMNRVPRGKGNSKQVRKAKQKGRKIRQKLIAKKVPMAMQPKPVTKTMLKEKSFAKSFLKEEKTVIKQADLTGLVSVRLNAKTIVWVKPGTDVEKIKKQLGL